MMKRNSPRAAWALTAAIVTSVGLTSCSGSPTLEADVETMIEFEATWQCEVHRFAYESSDEIEERKASVRGRFAVTAEDHKIFTDMVEDDDELREALAMRNDELCPVVES